MKTEEKYTRKMGGITANYRLVEDDVPVILEDQRAMLMANNSRLGLASIVEIF